MRSAGVEEQGMFAQGLPWNLGDPAVSTSASRRQRIEAPAKFRRGAGQQQLPAASRRAEVRGTARANERERGGRGGGKSERLDSTDEAGEPIPRDPVEGSEASDYGTAGGKHERDTELATHVTKTSADS